MGIACSWDPNRQHLKVIMKEIFAFFFSMHKPVAKVEHDFFCLDNYSDSKTQSKLEY